MLYSSSLIFVVMVTKVGLSMCELTYIIKSADLANVSSAMYPMHFWRQTDIHTNRLTDCTLA